MAVLCDMASVYLRFGKRKWRETDGAGGYGYFPGAIFTTLIYCIICDICKKKKLKSFCLYCLVNVMLQAPSRCERDTNKETSETKAKKQVHMLTLRAHFLRTHCIINDNEHESPGCSYIMSHGGS